MFKKVIEVRPDGSEVEVKLVPNFFHDWMVWGFKTAAYNLYWLLGAKVGLR